MSYTLRIAPQAANDIAEVLDFTLDKFGEKQRARYQQIIRDGLQLLGTDPQNPRSKSRPEIHPHARTMHLARRGKHARHLFLYRIIEPDFVDIARLLHDSMELERHLPEDFGEAE